MDPYVGEIRLFAGSYAPMDWAFCYGQQLNISQYSALYSIIGNTFGGDGRTFFHLPDLRGKAPMHQGQGPGLTQRDYAESGGSETVTLLETEIPNHSHTVNAASAGTQSSPTDGVWANPGRRSTPLYAPAPTVASNPLALGAAGGSQPHNNMQPHVGMNYIICLQGIYPPKTQ